MRPKTVMQRAGIPQRSIPMRIVVILTASFMLTTDITNNAIKQAKSTMPSPTITPGILCQEEVLSFPPCCCLKLRKITARPIRANPIAPRTPKVMKGMCLLLTENTLDELTQRKLYKEDPVIRNGILLLVWLRGTLFRGVVASTGTKTDTIFVHYSSCTFLGI